MSRRIVYVTLVHSRMPQFTSVTRVVGVSDAREAYRIAFSRLQSQIERGEKPGPYADWRLDHVTFSRGGRMTALIPVPSRR